MWGTWSENSQHVLCSLGRKSITVEEGSEERAQARCDRCMACLILRLAVVSMLWPEAVRRIVSGRCEKERERGRRIGNKLDVTHHGARDLATVALLRDSARRCVWLGMREGYHRYVLYILLNTW